MTDQDKDALIFAGFLLLAGCLILAVVIFIACGVIR